MLAVELVAAALCRITTGTWPAFGSVPLYLLLLATVFSTPWQAGEEIGWLLLLMLMHAAINNMTAIVPSSESMPPGVFSLHATTLAWLTIVVLWAGAAYFLIRIRSATPTAKTT